MQEPDHRVRVAAERRERMRTHLLQSALALLTTKGPEGAVIDEIVRAADVSRGTFYKYYASPADLVLDLAQRLADDLIVTVNTLTTRYDDPAVRAAMGLRAILGLVAICPRIGAFVVRAGWPLGDPSHAFFRLVGPNMADGLSQGRFRPHPPELYLSLIGGLAVGSIHAMISAPVGPGFAEEAAEVLLCGLGIEAAEARHIAAMPMVLPEPQADTFLGRIMAGVERQAKGNKTPALAAPGARY